MGGWVLCLSSSATTSSPPEFTEAAQELLRLFTVHCESYFKLLYQQWQTRVGARTTPKPVKIFFRRGNLPLPSIPSKVEEEVPRDFEACRVAVAVIFFRL